jgi:hypothetical protein
MRHNLAGVGVRRVWEGDIPGDDAGHGILFQHPDEFGKDVLDFLR